MSSQVVIELDSQGNAAYVQLSDSEVHSTRQLTDSVLVDLDEMGVVVGIEVLALDAEIPLTRLSTECHVHSNVIDVLKMFQPSVGAFAMRTNSSAEGVGSARTRSSLMPA